MNHIDYDSQTINEDIYTATDRMMQALIESILVNNPTEDIQRIVDHNPRNQTVRFGISVLTAACDSNGSGLLLEFSDQRHYSADFYNQPKEDVTTTQTVNGLRTEYTWTFNHVYDHQGYQVAASFNPYSHGNIIGSIEETFHGGPMLFPYDRNPEVKIWICDQYAIPIETKDVVGFIDLDLIVDNSNSYSVDD
jgi:hypothetical protein